MRLNLSRIREATDLISPEFQNSPQFESESLSEFLGCQLSLKVETLNPIRSFKGRGTDLAVAAAITEGFATVICASAGNLGQALAYSARRNHICAEIVASRNANKEKLERIRQLGGRLTLVDGDIEDARSTASELATNNGWYLIEDSEHIATCEGAATIGLEIASSNFEPEIVLISLGGGAMATGVGFVLKQVLPSTKVICVQPSGAPAMTLSYRRREVVNTETISTIADGVAGRCPIPEVLDDLLQVADEALLVEESSIIAGMNALHTHAGLVAEPSAALGIAVILENPTLFDQKKVLSIVCGGNVDRSQFLGWISDK